MNKSSSIIYAVLLVCPILTFAQTKSVAELQRVHSAIDVNSFNQQAKELGLIQGIFAKNNKEIYFSNGKQLKLSELERLQYIGPNSVVISKSNDRMYPTERYAVIYGNDGNVLFEKKMDYSFSLRPVGTEKFIVSRSYNCELGDLVFLNKAGEELHAISRVCPYETDQPAYVSPDKSYLIINFGRRPKEHFLIAFDNDFNELWRKTGLRSHQQLAICDDKVAIGNWGGEVLIFDKTGEQIGNYKVAFPYDSVVAFSEDGRYLAVASCSRTKQGNSYRTIYLYLINVRKQEIMENWPIILDSKELERNTPTYITFNKGMVAFSFVGSKRNRPIDTLKLYNFQANELFETMIKEVSSLQKHFIFFENDYLEILSSGKANIFKIDF